MGLVEAQPQSAVVEAAGPAESPAPPQPADGVDQAGKFNDIRKEYIAGKRKEGMSFKEASDSWMSCSQRSDLLSNMSFAELKKRRFV